MPPTLDALLAKCEFFSGETTAQELGVSRTAVFKRIQALRKSGYVIEAVAGRGYRLAPRFDGLLPLEIRAKSKAKIFGKELNVLDSTDSTQIRLRELADRGAAEGAVLVALRQSAGKGRMGHPWSSPKGGLWFSLLIRPSCRISEIYKLTLLFGVAVAKSLMPYGIEARLKWPNDVLVGGKKICGILLESSAEPDRIDYVIAGIGINANLSSGDLPAEFNCRSTSLRDLLGKPVDRAELLARILGQSERLYFSSMDEGFGMVIDEWKSISCTLGRKVCVSSFGRALTGTAVDIDQDGALIVATENGKKEKIFSGDVDFC